jgi:hypothetical protein
VEHAAVAHGEHEAEVVELAGVLGVEADELVEEDVAQGRGPHGEPGLAFSMASTARNRMVFANRSTSSAAATSVARSRTGHRGCIRGRRARTKPQPDPPWRRARWEWESAATISSRMRLPVGSPARPPPSCRALPWPPRARTRESELNGIPPVVTRAGEQASRGSVGC